MHDKIRKALAALFVAVVAAFGVIVTQTPAQAAYGDCANYAGTVCMIQHGNFTGQVWRQYPSQFLGRCRDFSPEGFNDEATVVFNSSDTSIFYIYQHQGCTGARYTVPKGRIVSFAQEDTWWNDKASSGFVQWVG